MARTGVHHHALGLIDHQQRRIFVKNIQRYRLRYDLRFHRVRNRKADPVALVYFIIGFDRFIPYQYPSFPHQLLEKGAGIIRQSGSQVAVNPIALLFPGHLEIHVLHLFLFTLLNFIYKFIYIVFPAFFPLEAGKIFFFVVKQADQKQNRHAGAHINIGHIEDREIDQSKVKKINHIAVKQAVYHISQGAGAQCDA